MLTLRKGDRVVMTKKGRRMFPRSPISGVVTSTSDLIHVKVLRDGLKTSVGWHRSFWKKVRT